MRKVENLEKKIKYRFIDQALLEQALRHSSYTNENQLDKTACNERLEFLGDAVLELITSEFLFQLYPKESEGALTKIRAGLVCESALAFAARRIELGSHLFLGKGEASTGGRERDSINADALEALIGAIYLDGGFTSAKEFVIRVMLEDVENKKLFFDSKTILQELVQGNFNRPIIYQLVKEEGPDHIKSFTVQVKVGDTVHGEGKGRTKKAAEQEAAYHAILSIKASPSLLI